MFKKIVKEALTEFFESDEGQKLIGTIVLHAINISMTRDIVLEDGKSEPGRKIEKEVTVNMVDWLIKYMPHVEGAIRGVQEDANKATNNSAKVLMQMRVLGEALVHMAENIPQLNHEEIPLIEIIDEEN